MITIKLTDIGPQGPQGPQGPKGEPGDGDMKKEVYDPNNNGVVDNSEKLDGHSPNYFMEKVFVPEYNCFEVLT